MNKHSIIYTILIVLITTHVSSQTKKDTFDFIVYMIENQSLDRSVNNGHINHESYGAMQIQSANFNQLTIKVKYTRDYYTRQKRQPYDIVKEETIGVYNFQGIIRVSEVFKSLQGFWSVSYNSKIGTKNITGTRWLRNGQTGTNNVHLLILNIFTYDSKYKAVKMYKALKKMQEYEKFSPELF